MVDQIIRPADLPNRADPVASEKIPVDNGVTVGGATIQSIVESGRPAASQSEAEAGINAEKAMTPLTSRQGLLSQIGVTIASKAQGDKADSAIQEIVEGANTTVDNTDPQRPIISSSGNPSVGFKSDIVVVDGQTDWRIARNYKTVSALLADDGSGDMGMGYAGSGANVIVSPGDIVIAQGFRYEVAASGATDFHVETAGGVKLYVVSDGPLNVLAFGAVGDRTTDDYTAIQKAFDVVPEGGAIYLPKRGGTLPSYYTSQSLVLTKGDVSIFSNPLSEYTEGLYSDQAIDILDVRAYGLRLDNIGLMGDGSTNTFATTNGIKIDQSSRGDAETYSNLDAVITNCFFFNLKDCIKGKGRNVLTQNCMFSQSKRGVVGELHTYGGGTVSSFRGWRVLGNRFHNMGSPYHSAGSSEPVPANLSLLDSWCVEMPLNSNVASHIEVKNNNYDVGMAGFYKGPLAASAIDDNIGYLVNPILVYSPMTDSSAISFSAQYSQSISGNKVNARQFPDERRGHTIAAHHLVVNGTRNLMVRGNALHNAYDRSVVMTETNGLRLSDNDIINANTRFIFDAVQRNAVQILTANNVRVKDNDIVWNLAGTAYDIGLVMTGTGIKVRDTTVTGATTRYSIPATSLMGDDDDALDWQTPSMTNAFVLDAGLSKGYRKRFDGYVEVDVVLTGGSSGAQAFALPLGYRPATTVQIAGVGRDEPAYMTVAPGGSVTVNWAGTVGSLNLKVRFPAS